MVVGFVGREKSNISQGQDAFELLNLFGQIGSRFHMGPNSGKWSHNLK